MNIFKLKKIWDETDHQEENVDISETCFYTLGNKNKLGREKKVQTERTNHIVREACDLDIHRSLDSSEETKNRPANTSDVER